MVKSLTHGFVSNLTETDRSFKFEFGIIKIFSYANSLWNRAIIKILVLRQGPTVWIYFPNKIKKYQMILKERDLEIN